MRAAAPPPPAPPGEDDEADDVLELDRRWPRSTSADEAGRAARPRPAAARRQPRQLQPPLDWTNSPGRRDRAPAAGRQSARGHGPRDAAADAQAMARRPSAGDRRRACQARDPRITGRRLAAQAVVGGRCCAAARLSRAAMTELAKTFEPGPIEARWYAHWEGEGLFRPDAARRRALYDRHAAAQRHRQPAHRPRARHHASGHPHPPRADAGQGRAVGGRHRPCRDRDPDGGRAQLDQRQKKRTDFTRDEFVAKVWEWKAESGGADHPPAAPPRRQLRLGQ